MCFAYSVNFNKNALTSQLQLTELPSFVQPNAVKAFTNPILPVVVQSAVMRLELMQWGLLPNWIVSDEQAAEFVKNTYNARAETIDQKPSFKEAYAHYRCIIPVAGFFEWQHINKRKYPHYIYPKHEELFYLAGIYSKSNSKQTFSIITIAANELMEQIHNVKKRQPAILPLSMVKPWLNFELSNTDIPIFPSELMKSHFVSPIISQNQNYNQESVVKPYLYPEFNQGSLF